MAEKARPMSNNEQPTQPEEPQKPIHPLDALPPEPEPAYRPPVQRKPPSEDRPILTYILLGINVLIFIAMFASEELRFDFLLQGAIIPELVLREGQWYRLLTGMFLHADPAHIFFNGYALYIIGATLEPLFGRSRYLVLYFLGGLAGSVFSVTFGEYLIPSIGASGAVFALFTAEGVHYYQHRHVYNPAIRRQLQQIVILIVLNFGIGLLSERIDNWGHFGGVVGGFFLTWFAGAQIPKPKNPVKSLQELGQTDTNPIRNNLPLVVIYCIVLIAICWWASQFVGIGT